ncbi:MAG: RHS repeat-associated core domain-containing protein [Caldilineaceae bacterium]
MNSLTTTGSGAGTSQAYCAYGKRRYDTTCGSGNGLPTDRHFTGQLYDDTGLHYYAARYYDDHLGQFISPDTLVPDATSVLDYNRYLYVRGRVLNANDPSGHRLYFAAGAGHDPDNTGYPQMMVSVFADAGIANPVDITAHGNKWSDIAFTIGDNSRYPAEEAIPYVTFSSREEISQRQLKLTSMTVKCMGKAVVNYLLERG